jgi:hypothetical protein
MGSDGVHALNDKYRLGFNLHGLAHYERVPWKRLALSLAASARATPDALDLLDRLLR